MKIQKGRAQGLEGAKGRIGNVPLYIRNLLKKKRKIKILEVGTGYGRALLELKKIFQNKVEIYGTNLEKEWDRKRVKKYAIHEGFSFKEKDIPKIYILDAGKGLPFKRESFDFVFCQATMQYVIDRALFIKEVNSILTEDGIAVLELQEFRNDHPPEYKDMIEIWKDGKRIGVLNYLKKFKNIKIKKSKGRDWHYIVMRKAKKFNLKLKLVRHVELEDISPTFWGRKVIYSLQEK